jgi:hypothetical protein
MKNILFLLSIWKFKTNSNIWKILKNNASFW